MSERTEEDEDDERRTGRQDVLPRGTGTASPLPPSLPRHPRAHNINHVAVAPDPFPNMLGFFGGGAAEEEPEEQELSVPSQTELLVDRLATSTLIEDRRDAAEELKVLAEGNWESGMNFVGKIGMRPILEALSPRPRDEELTLVLLDCLTELVRVPQDGEVAAAAAERRSGKDQPVGLTPRDTCLFNTEFLLALTSGAQQQHQQGGVAGGFGEEDELMGGMELLVGGCLGFLATSISLW